MRTKDWLNKLLTPVSTDELHKLYEKITGASAPTETAPLEEPLYPSCSEPCQSPPDFL